MENAEQIRIVRKKDTKSRELSSQTNKLSDKNVEIALPFKGDFDRPTGQQTIYHQLMIINRRTQGLIMNK